jgi:hypothetical protein
MMIISGEEIRVLILSRIYLSILLSEPATQKNWKYHKVIFQESVKLHMERIVVNSRNGDKREKINIKEPCYQFWKYKERKTILSQMPGDDLH